MRRLSLQTRMNPSPHTRLRIHAFSPLSFANGPGRRAVIWLQGCSLRCRGCFNPRAQSPEGGRLMETRTLFRKVAALGDSIEGLTLTGGEPLDQRRELQLFLRQVREALPLSIILFTGYAWKALRQMPEAAELLRCLDVVVAGAYRPSNRPGTTRFGGPHKTTHFLTRRYSPSDLRATPDAEVIISPEGRLIFSGLAPIVPDGRTGGNTSRKAAPHGL